MQVQCDRIPNLVAANLDRDNRFASRRQRCAIPTHNRLGFLTIKSFARLRCNGVPAMLLRPFHLRSLVSVVVWPNTLLSACLDFERVPFEPALEHRNESFDLLAV